MAATASLTLCALSALLALAPAPALAARGHIFGKSFGSSGSGEGQFKEPAGVAVNEATGQIYVVDKGDNRVEYFSAEGVYEGQFSGVGAPEPLSEPMSVAVDNSCHLQKLIGSACASVDPSNEDIYVAEAGSSGSVYKFTSDGEYVSQITGVGGESFDRLYGVGAAEDGKLFIYNETEFGGELSTNVAVFTNEIANQYIETRHSALFSLAAPQFAVNASEHFYVGYKTGTEAHEEAQIAELASNGAPINEAFCTNEDESAVAVEAVTEDVYLDNIATIARCSAEGSLLERFGAGQLTQSDGLATDAASSTVYVADAGKDAVDVFTLEPPAPPLLEEDSITAAGATDATISAQIHVRGETSEYTIEYGPCPNLAGCAGSPYGQQTAPISAGSPFEFVTVSGELTGLTAHTTYHARVIVDNAKGNRSYGPELTFTTYPAGPELGLPDNRAWELISPPNKHGAVLLPIGDAMVQAAAQGGAITYASRGPVEEATQGSRYVSQVLAWRGPAQVGWSSQEITAPIAQPAGIRVGDHEFEYRLFSADLSLGLLEPSTQDPLFSDEASGWTFYLRHDFVPSLANDANAGQVSCAESPSACWTPLVTSKEGYADIQPPGSEFAPPLAEGATPDLGHVALSVQGRLEEWTGAAAWEDRLSVVGVLPAGEGAVNVECNTGGSALLGDSEDFGMGNAISDDGSRVVFEVEPTENCGATALQHHLYLRDVTDGKTIRLDMVRPGAEQTQREAEAPAPRFQAASADGSKVYFTDVQRLTEASGHGDLYLCEVAATTATGELECTLTDITPKNEAGESAEVQGQVLGAGEDGSYVYFAAQGALGDAQARGASRGDCSEAKGTSCNLYAYHDGVTWYIATLAGGKSTSTPTGDSSDWTVGRYKTARVSPNGRWLAFTSDRPLTGYDNRDASSGERDEEVYLYNGVTHKLVCASCDPTGARPQGELIENETSYVDDYAQGPWQHRWVAATVPSLTRMTLDRSAYQSRYLSNGGRLFFDAYGVLAPHDTNGNWDVYQYEPPRGEEQAASDGCGIVATDYSERSEGCVSLISSGTAQGESVFLDASESGDDVFFLTAAKLVPRDVDTTEDVYDAHACTSASPCTAEPAEPLPCTDTESCRQAPQPQPTVFGQPSSAMFSGVGDLRPVKPPHTGLSTKQKLKRALDRCDARYKHNKHKRSVCKRKVRQRFHGLRSHAHDSRKHANPGSGRRGR